ncbi:hypothetical protein [Nocardioides speluncae]|uniref:hypothetical protein n=1 Tax=Nocardioides speluncae TaxID=2670337 RepID=UPI000D69F3A3|nr:hypothetical protein [Nocardioides speluncae]
MTTPPDLAALACEDCPAEVHTEAGAGLFGPVRIVTVVHDDTCPWLTRVAPEGATHVSAEGILMHVFRDVASQESP